MLETIKIRLSKFDWVKWRKNTLVFVSPLAVLYLLSVIANINADGISLADFHINPALMGAMVLYVLNVALDFFKKFQATK